MKTIVDISIDEFCSTWFVVYSLDFFCRYNLKKLTYEERKAKLVERLKALNSAADDDEDDE
jgi:hypothetical protein